MPTMTDCIILTQKTEYELCHLSLPDEATPIAGINFKGDYYSFFKLSSSMKRSNVESNRLRNVCNFEGISLQRASLGV